VQPLAKSPLVVFFPTVVESHLGFLVQGPYRTTPSRDNIPPGEPWNQHLVKETSGLLVDAMRWMRDNAMLDVAALRCLPLDREKFPKDSRFAPMFDAVRQAFQDEALLPTFDDGHVAARKPSWRERKSCASCSARNRWRRCSVRRSRLGCLMTSPGQDARDSPVPDARTRCRRDQA
jgi:hypothetical protein